MTLILDPLPPNEQPCDELSGSQVVKALEESLAKALTPHVGRDPVCGLPQACPEFLMTDCRFEPRVRGLVMVITVREVLTVKDEKTIRLRVSKAWLRNLVARAQRMGL